ncbi:hypothetical protein [Campylobacter troglodytis]|uniref:hypothetical protein n=1 Tax=Campylobacter troglodytis TaxID=654363 RepID=UPI001158B0FB|nr:hypothetical protein [Campylobacter troglodytis]
MDKIFVISERSKVSQALFCHTELLQKAKKLVIQKEIFFAWATTCNSQSCYAQNISRDFSLSTKAQNDKQRDFFAWATSKSPAESLRSKYK